MKHIKNKNNGLKTFVFAFLFLLFTINSIGQSIFTKIDRDSVLIGEPIQLTVEIKDVKEYSPIQFKVGDSLGKDFEILELGKLDSNQNSGKQIVTVTSFEIGNKYIPPIGVFEDGKKVISEPILVNISLVDADTTKPFLDIKPIVRDPLNFNDKMKMGLHFIQKYWIVFLTLFLVLLFLIWFFFIRKKKEIEEKTPVKEKIPAHIVAFKQLKEIEDKELWQNDNQKQYNIELTETIQEYISNRYNVTTAEKTTAEILTSLRFIEMGDSNKSNLKKLLMLSDLVKFAKEKPTSIENEQVLKDAYEFIETTKQDKI